MAHHMTNVPIPPIGIAVAARPVQVQVWQVIRAGARWRRYDACMAHAFMVTTGTDGATRPATVTIVGRPSAPRLTRSGGVRISERVSSRVSGREMPEPACCGVARGAGGGGAGAARQAGWQAGSGSGRRIGQGVCACARPRAGFQGRIGCVCVFRQAFMHASAGAGNPPAPPDM